VLAAHFITVMMEGQRKSRSEVFLQWSEGGIKYQIPLSQCSTFTTEFLFRVLGSQRIFKEILPLPLRVLWISMPN
jgi:hypothetical protein